MPNADLFEIGERHPYCLMETIKVVKAAMEKFGYLSENNDIPLHLAELTCELSYRFTELLAKESKCREHIHQVVTTTKGDDRSHD